MQIWKISILFLLVSEMEAYYDLKFDFFHKDNCAQKRAEVQNLQQVTCTKDNCGTKYHKKMKAYCKYCDTEKEMDIPGCNKHGYVV
jgi:hypothetical protein